jgi:hypothetical protein
MWGIIVWLWKELISERTSVNFNAFDVVWKIQETTSNLD